MRTYIINITNTTTGASRMVSIKAASQEAAFAQVVQTGETAQVIRTWKSK